MNLRLLPDTEGPVPVRDYARRWILAGLLLGLPFAFALAACGGPERSAASPGTVTVQNAGRSLRFPRAPKRAVSLNQNGTEMLLALGLKDRIVGAAHADNSVAERFREAYRTLPVLADRYPSLEVLLSVRPDFVYGFRSAFTPPKGPATIARLESFGITPYVDRMFTDPGLRIEDVHGEIRTLGRIFRVEERAREVVHRLRRRARRALQGTPPREEPVRVAVYDSGRDAPYTAGESLLTHLIERAGGRNVFAGRIGKAWGSVSWERLVAEDPQLLVIMDYGARSAQEKIRFLRDKPGLQDVDAVRRDRFVVVPLATTFVGVRYPEALRRLSRAIARVPEGDRAR